MNILIILTGCGFCILILICAVLMTIYCHGMSRRAYLPSPPRVSIELTDDEIRLFAERIVIEINKELDKSSKTGMVQDNETASREPTTE